MSQHPSRRYFLQTAATAGAVAGLGEWAGLAPFSPARAEDAKGKTLRVSGGVDSLAWSPDSGTLAVVTKPGQDVKDWKDRKYAIRLYDVKAGQKPQTLSETTNATLSATFSPDGKALAGVFWEPVEVRKVVTRVSRVRLFDPTTGKEMAALAGAPLEGLGVEFNSDLLTAAYSPDGKLLAGGGKLVSAGGAGVFLGGHIGGEVCVWDVRTGKVKWHNRTTHTDIVYAIAFAPDGRTLASGGIDKLVRLWDPETGELKKTLFGVSRDGLISLAFSPDGAVLASGGYGLEEGGNIRLWDVEAGRLAHTIKDIPTDFLVRIAFARDGKTLFGAFEVKDAKPPTWQVRQWEVATGKSIGVLAEGKRAFREICVSPDGKTLAVDASGGEVLLYDLQR
jgi:WD40 repeat protein